MKQRVDSRLVNNEQGYLKWTLKPRFVTQKLSDNDFLAIRKIKTTFTKLTLNKPVYMGICILELN